MRFFHNSVAAFKTFYWQIKNAEKNQQSTTRWGLFQLFTAIAFFCFGLVLAFLSIVFYVWEHCMGLAIGLSIVAFMFAIFGAIVVVKALILASKWLAQDSKDPTATKQDLEQLKQDLIRELKK